MKKQILFFIFLLSGNWIYSQDYSRTFRFVNAENGLRVRENPGKTGEVLINLAYGTVVELIPNDTIFQDVVMDEGKKIKGHWVKIAYEYNFSETGYVFDAYLVKHLEKIPPQSLYYFAGLSVEILQDNEEFENYTIEYFDQIYSEDFGYFTNAAAPRYAPYWQEPVYKNADLPEGTTPIDVLKQHIQLELIDEKEVLKMKSNKPKNNYEIEQNIQVHNLAETEWQNKFYVPIKDGTDSVLVEDYAGEGYVSKTYLGEIPKLNIHLIHNQYEDCWVTSIDKDTGEENSFMYGLPFLSPNRKCQLTFDIDYYSELGYLFVEKFDENNNVCKRFSISFKSWMPRLFLDSAFWISDTELIFQALPVDNLINDSGSNPSYYQFVKLTVL